MEVEVKLRLANAEAYRHVTTLLSPFHVITHHQHNHFFDGTTSELSSRHATLRLRFYNDNQRCVVSLKSKGVLVNGVRRVEEDEEDLNPKTGRECVAEPGKLGSVESRILRRVKEEFGVVGENGFLGLGGFRNLRNVYDWKGLKLEVDETDFDFGTLFEIECESADPEEAKRVLEEFLKENGIDYSYSVASKFSIFRSGKLAHQSTRKFICYDSDSNSHHHAKKKNKNQNSNGTKSCKVITNPLLLEDLRKIVSSS
ncbi:triphosphate tunnel metalloenzyme 3-like isoform X2 [Trifolium pratense]|uniref:triphosphate tunnel metalloenzyme 3-like isoform X2 n=1 Tax=Trifolium pratense TaxID=57577 RepID=UPI001E691D54|nr:triphosphate tunnel metalloenzyme 3-like isoform X2 [Trifolium pratense]